MTESQLMHNLVQCITAAQTAGTDVQRAVAVEGIRSLMHAYVETATRQLRFNLYHESTDGVCRIAWPVEPETFPRRQHVCGLPIAHEGPHKCREDGLTFDPPLEPAP